MTYLFLHFLSALDCISLVLCGKSNAEIETAIAIKANNTLKLPDKGELSLVLHSELNKSVEQNSFQVSSFMNSLSTNQFGRLLIWSPRLTSTHDVVSKYVFYLFPFLCFVLMFGWMKNDHSPLSKFY